VYSADTTGIVATAGGDGTTVSALVGNQLAQSRVKPYLNLGSWRAVAEHAIKDSKARYNTSASSSAIPLTLWTCCGLPARSHAGAGREHAPEQQRQS
jgi:hypothetical protein